MDFTAEQIETARRNAAAFSAKLSSLTLIIGPSVCLTEGETEWTRWFLYADPAMTQCMGQIRLKLDNSKRQDPSTMSTFA